MRRKVQRERVRSGGWAKRTSGAGPDLTGENIWFSAVKDLALADYDVSGMDGTARASARILAAGSRIPLAGLGRWRVRTAGPDLVAATRDDRPDLLVLEAGLVDPALAAALAEPLLADLPLILVVEDDEAEAAGLLLERRVALLEAGAGPEALEAAAVAALAGRGDTVADAGRGFDADSRLAALKRDADRVAAALAELAGARTAEPARPVTAARIRAHIKARRQRERFFEAGLFADPVWDMLLDLAAARLEERPVSISSLCIAGAVPTTTGLRTIKALVERGLLVRRVDPRDARRSFIGMSDGCATAMEACLEAVLNLPGQ